MKIRSFVQDGVFRTEVIDPSDGAVTHTCQITEGQQCVVTVPAASSPADIEFGDVEAIPAPEAPADGGETPADGQTEAGETPTTSAASEKPLYLVDTSEGAIDAPEGFEASGLETPDGRTLYHYASDAPGSAATGNVDGVSIYADADDDEQPVQPAAPVAAEQPGEAEGAEAPADGTGQQSA